ncbi:serine/threonine-protein kinase Chk1-like protein [Leptotrombidium deliense]|uniref:non-specific serine/threonine protein kinase n=1 Tax=Leptotrombidium deliense TaxID=299467 RepID=A0A443S7D8_9ACAR|nr:serine/threonine-protein kinase Chk1-like protein [Leptotrombidium deliense]
MADIRLDEWRVLHSIGEGAFGEVRFLLHRQTNATLAVKIIDVEKFKHSVKTVKKEIAIHKLLSHENIIKFCGHVTEGNFEYIFLQYASGGELFDKIEPDVGMSQTKAHRYFCELICGVTYLHGLGITHRDIKPENLLLDDQDVIKISDFGMATLFRHNGVERKLNNKCGSFPYMAPEVYVGKEYRAEPADIWSCGIVLIAMLAGELPWDEPTLLKKMLNPSPKSRYSLEDIKNHKWILAKNSFCRSSPVSSHKKLCDYPRFSATQPLQGDNETDIDSICNYSQEAKIQSFSQPTNPEHMILNTQLQSSQVNSSLNIYQKLVKRMTRFFVKTDARKTVDELSELFKKLQYCYKKSSTGTITISATDKRKMPLVFKASIIEVTSEEILVDFRLSRGDGIEFKRHFLRLRDGMQHIIVKTPLTWSLAVATNSLP